MSRTQLVPDPGPAGAAAIRPAGPADVAALGEFFAGLSAQSLYLRFFAPVTLTRGLLDLLSGGPAHVDAVIAVADGVIVGHAMAADRAGSGGRRGALVTDIGVVVADAWQGRGVGSALMIALVARARQREVTSLEMDVLHGNKKALALITGHWPSAVIDRAWGSLSISIPLPAYRRQPPRTRPAGLRSRAHAAVRG